MGFFTDLIKNSNEDIAVFQSKMDNLSVIEELLEFYGLEKEKAGEILQQNLYNANEKLTESKLFSLDRKVLRLVLYKDGNPVGTVSFTLRGTNSYEIGYFILEQYRGNSNIASVLSLIRETALKHGIKLTATVNKDNKASIYLIGHYLGLTVNKETEKTYIYGG